MQGASMHGASVGCTLIPVYGFVCMQDVTSSLCMGISGTFKSATPAAMCIRCH